MFLPHLNGERSPFTDPLARGAFINLSARTTQQQMCRAVLEGVAYNYRALAASLGVELGGGAGEASGAAGDLRPLCAPPPPPPLDPLLLVGGGARSQLWTQTLADVLGRPVKPVADASAVGARGCAAGAFQYLGLWGGSRAPPHARDSGVGRHPLYFDSRPLYPDSRPLYPNPDLYPESRSLYPESRSLYPESKPLYPEPFLRYKRLTLSPEP